MPVELALAGLNVIGSTKTADKANNAMRKEIDATNVLDFTFFTFCHSSLANINYRKKVN